MGGGGRHSQAYTLTVQADNMLRSVIEVNLTSQRPVRLGSV